MDIRDMLEYVAVSDEGIVIATLYTILPGPVNYAGDAVVEALVSVTGIESADDPGPGFFNSDAVWVFAVDPATMNTPGGLRFVDIPADIAETIHTAAASAPVEGKAVASVPDPSVAALVASLAEIDGIDVLTLDPRDPAATLASMAAVTGEDIPRGSDSR
jgi:hypothetical protein